MRLTEYQQKAMAFCMPTSNNRAYMLFNFIAEVGELLENVRIDDYDYELGYEMEKIISSASAFGRIAKGIRKGVTQPPEIFIKDFGKFSKELGDCEWQLSGVEYTNGLTKEEVCEDNLCKLTDRKERGVIDGSGDNR